MRLESEHMKRENANLREANHQANVLLNELKEKLTFSQGTEFFVFFFLGFLPCTTGSPYSHYHFSSLFCNIIIQVSCFDVFRASYQAV